MRRARARKAERRAQSTTDGSMSHEVSALCAPRSTLVRRVRSPACKPGSVVPALAETDGHFSRDPVARILQQPTRGCAGIEPPTLARRAVSRRLFGLAPAGVYPATPVAGRAVGSYPTISTLPDPWLSPGPSAVCFLWHCPSHPERCAQALPGSLPCGARTFLERMLATVRPMIARRNIAGSGERRASSVPGVTPGAIVTRGAAPMRSGAAHCRDVSGRASRHRSRATRR